MRKAIELLKVYLIDAFRNPVNIMFSTLIVFGVLGVTGFVLNEGTTGNIVASYAAFIASYAAVNAVAYSITGEKEKGLYRMYRSSRLSKREYVSEKILLAFIPLFFSLAVILVGYMASSIHLSVLIAPILVLCVLSHAGIGLFFAAYFNTHEDMHKLITIFLIAMMFLAPVFYTTENLPNIVQISQQFVPLTHGVDAMRAVLVNGSGAESISKNLLILLTLTVLPLVAGYRKLDF